MILSFLMAFFLSFNCFLTVLFQSGRWMFPPEIYRKSLQTSSTATKSFAIASEVVSGPKLNLTAVSWMSRLMFIAARIGRFCFFAEQALPVEMQKPFASSARTITFPGIPLNAAWRTYGLKSFCVLSDVSARMAGTSSQFGSDFSDSMKFFTAVFCSSKLRGT